MCICPCVKWHLSNADILILMARHPSSFLFLGHLATLQPHGKSAARSQELAAVDWSVRHSHTCLLWILCLLCARCPRYRDKLYCPWPWPRRSRFADRGGVQAVKAQPRPAWGQENTEGDRGPGQAGSLCLEEAPVLRGQGPAPCRLPTEPGEPRWRASRSPGWALGHQPEGLALLGYDELWPCKGGGRGPSIAGSHLRSSWKEERPAR